MEKSNIIVVNGRKNIKLPIGYRFRPTDEELVIHYLKRKVFGMTLPASVIPVFDVFLTHPSCFPFPGEMREKRYSFSKETYGNKLRRIADASGCYWKYIGQNKQIVNPENKQVVGVRKTLIFHEKKSSLQGTQTRWVLHEYCLVGSGIGSMPNSTQISVMGMDNWVVHCLFQKRRRLKKLKSTASLQPEIQKSEVIRPSCMDSIVEEDGHENEMGPPPSSSSSSGTNQVYYNNYLDQEAESSTYV